MAQDLPPVGGYEPIQYKVCFMGEDGEWCLWLEERELMNGRGVQRNLPARGFRPSYYLAAMGIIMTYGLYRAGQGIREQKYAPSHFPKSTQLHNEHDSRAAAPSH